MIEALSNKESRIINLPKILDSRGNLSYVEEVKNIPFKIERVYWIYDVPGGEIRGGHAFRKQQELIIALSGSFDIVVDDGKEEQSYSLNRSYYGLYLPAGLWRHMRNFSTNALALVLSSTQFSENDYIRDYSEFLKNSLREDKIQNVQNHKRIKQIPFSNPKISTVFDCPLLDLDVNHRNKGNITVVENNKTVLSDIKRVYYLYDIPGGESRGGHAHMALHQLIIAASGSFDVMIDDGREKRTVTLNRSHLCLYIVPGIWREITNFSSGSICLVLASEFFDENDYIRDYSHFLTFRDDTSIIRRSFKKDR